jgi:hypothetical protein
MILLIMFSIFASKHKFQSQKGETLLLQRNLSRSNTIVPKSIQWKPYQKTRSLKLSSNQNLYNHHNQISNSNK